jgi:hypothetical protein
MSRKEIEEAAEDIWIRNNPSEIATWNTEKIEFVKAFVEGVYFAIDKQIILPDLSDEQIDALNKATSILLEARKERK